MANDIYKVAVEKFQMSEDDPGVQFSKTEVAALLEVQNMDIVELADQDHYVRQDLLRLTRVIPDNGSKRKIEELSKVEYDSLLNDYLVGKRNGDGDYVGFFKLQEISRLHKVSPRSLLKYALQNGWHQLRMRASMELADYQKELAIAEIEQIKPRIAVKSLRFCEMVLDKAYNGFTEGDIDAQKDYVIMVRSMLTVLKTERHISKEKMEEFNTKLNEVHDAILANVDRNLAADDLSIRGEQIEDADFETK